MMLMDIEMKVWFCVILNIQDLKKLVTQLLLKIPFLIHIFVYPYIYHIVTFQLAGLDFEPLH